MSLCSYIPGIFRAVYARQSRQEGIVQYAQNERLIFVQFFFVDKWLVIWYTESDLWITYEEGKVDHELKTSN